MKNVYFVFDDEFEDIEVSYYGDMVVLNMNSSYSEKTLTMDMIRPALEKAISIYEDSLEILADDPVFFRTDSSNKVIKLFEDCVSGEIDLLDEGTCVVNLDENSSEFLKHNNFKEVIVKDTLSVSKDDYNKLISLFGDVDNLQLQVNGNDTLIDLDTYRKSVLIIDEIVSHINKYDLSPLEKVAFAYDLVRERVYNEVDDEDSKFDSRDLSSVLLGNNIVCLGYARVFNAVLEGLGIESKEHYLWNKNNTSGHANSMVYIKDDKYDLDGYYIFDPTFDSKKEDNNDYLSSYKHFGKSLVASLRTDKRYIDKEFSSNPQYFIEKFNEIYESGNYEELDKETLDQLNRISNQLIGTYLLPKIFIETLNLEIPNVIKFGYSYEEKVKNFQEETEKLLVCDISKSKLLDAIFTVRKIEHYEDPDKYPLSSEVFRKIFIDNDIMAKRSSEARFLYDIFHSDSITNDNDIKEDIEDKEIDKTNRILAFTRTLKKIKK